MRWQAEGHVCKRCEEARQPRNDLRTHLCLSARWLAHGTHQASAPVAQDPPPSRARPRPARTVARHHVDRRKAEGSRDARRSRPLGGDLYADVIVLHDAPATPHHRCPSIGGAGPSPGHLCSTANFAGHYVGAAVGSAVRLCSIFSAFPLPCFSAETAFRKRLRNALMNERKSNDGASLARVGT